MSGPFVRIIPTLLYDGVQLVKGERFDNWRRVGSVAQAVRVHNRREVDELLFLDVRARAEGRGPDFETVEEVAAECRCPLTVGGGVRDVADAVRLVQLGVEKVVFGGDFARADPGTVSDAAECLGSQSVVISFDHYVRFPEHAWATAVAVAAARLVAATRAGELLLQSVDRDGTMSGYDLDLVRAACAAVTVPVVASGGCSGPADMAAAVAAGASAVAAGALFLFREDTPLTCRDALAAAGVRVRK